MTTYFTWHGSGRKVSADRSVGNLLQHSSDRAKTSRLICFISTMQNGRTCSYIEQAVFQLFNRPVRSSCLVRVEAKRMDWSWPCLHFGDGHPFSPVPDVGRALAVRTHRAEQPPIGAKVQTADLNIGAWGGGGVTILNNANVVERHWSGLIFVQFQTTSLCRAWESRE